MWTHLHSRQGAVWLQSAYVEQFSEGIIPCLDIFPFSIEGDLPQALLSACALEITVWGKNWRLTKCLGQWTHWNKPLFKVFVIIVPTGLCDSKRDCSHTLIKPIYYYSEFQIVSGRDILYLVSTRTCLYINLIWHDCETWRNLSECR